MSTTPRTDAEAYDIHIIGDARTKVSKYPEADHVPADFACTLETELTAARQMLAESQARELGLREALDTLFIRFSHHSDDSLMIAKRALLQPPPPMIPTAEVKALVDACKLVPPCATPAHPHLRTRGFKEIQAVLSAIQNLHPELQ